MLMLAAFSLGAPTQQKPDVSGLALKPDVPGDELAGSLAGVAPLTAEGREDAPMA